MNNIYELENANNNDTSREKTIVKTSIIGIIANVALAAFKAVIGLMTHSIAIVLDAVNNISDAGSSLITILLGRYVKGVGEKVNSDSLINSGEDATLDSIISASTLVAAGIFLIFHISLEAWLGAIISVVIIKSGIEMLRDTISKILGEQNDPELARNIKHTVTSFPDVQGAYDLVLNNYGPDAWNGSIHVEVPDTYSADRLDLLIRKIQMAVYKEHHVALTAVGVYSVNTRDEEVIETRKKVREIVFSHPEVKQMHGFYLVKDRKEMRFDIVVSLAAKDRRAVYRETVSDVQKAFPDYVLQAAMDTDFAEE